MRRKREKRLFHQLTSVLTLKPAILLICIVLLPWGLFGCYTLRQAYYQNNLLNSRRPITDVLNDPATSSATREKLLFVQNILKFAREQDLAPGDMYTSFVPIDRDFVTCLVQAAYPERLEWLTHWFPIIGRVPYLGFFSVSDCKAKAEALKREGFDVAIGQADAFSSLGWFNDPIYSSMLKRDDLDLAHLLFHEMTHHFFWSPNRVEFNENLAEFVADELTRKYFSTLGDRETLNRYEKVRSDMQTYRAWLKELYQDLSVLYASAASQSPQYILGKKKIIFESFVSQRMPRFQTERFSFVAKREWNNAYVLAGSLYLAGYDNFVKAYKCFKKDSVTHFMRSLQERLKDFSDPDQAVASYCNSKQ